MPFVKDMTLDGIVAAEIALYEAVATASVDTHGQGDVTVDPLNRALSAIARKPLSMSILAISNLCGNPSWRRCGRTITGRNPTAGHHDFKPSCIGVVRRCLRGGYSADIRRNGGGRILVVKTHASDPTNELAGTTPSKQGNDAISLQSISRPKSPLRAS